MRPYGFMYIRLRSFLLGSTPIDPTACDAHLCCAMALGTFATAVLTSQRSTRLAITNFMQFSCTEIARRTATFL